MKHFVYKAMNSERQIIQGDTHVEAKENLDKYFLERNLLPIEIREDSENPLKGFLEVLLTWWKKKLFNRELITFTRQFGAAYGAGLPVTKALDILSAQAEHPYFKRTIQEISLKIQNGKGLLEAVSGYPNFFDSTYLAMLKSGEVTGNLDKVLNYLANLLEKKAAHRERISSTLLYPKLVVGMVVVTVIVVMIFVIPQFKKIFDKFEAELPTPTLLLIRGSDLFLAYWWTGVVIIPLMIFGWTRLQKNSDFLLWYHETMTSVPIIGTCLLKIELTHFCTTFSLLLRSGIRVTDATTISVNAMKNVFLRKELLKIIPVIEQGGTLAKAMGQIPVIPQLMSSMISMGEESGTLDALLDRVAILYDDETDQLLKKVPVLLEPIILGFLFAVVLFVALAVYLPMWRMASLIKK